MFPNDDINIKTAQTSSVADKLRGIDRHRFTYAIIYTRIYKQLLRVFELNHGETIKVLFLLRNPKNERENAIYDREVHICWTSNIEYQEICCNDKLTILNYLTQDCMRFFPHRLTPEPPLLKRMTTLIRLVDNVPLILQLHFHEDRGHHCILHKC